MPDPVVPKGSDRSVLFLGLAFVVAALTAFGAWWVVNNFQNELVDARQSEDTTEALVAARELNVGTVLQGEDMALGRVAVTVPSESLFTKKEDLAGVTVLERVYPGEALRTERLSTGGSTTLPETLLKPGTRAVSVRLDSASGVGGLLTPGAYVDVVVTIRPDPSAMGTSGTTYVTETILQGVRVLAIGDAMLGATATSKKADKDKKGAAAPREIVATLEVVPDEVEKLAMATARGELYLSLRARNDLELLQPDPPLITNAMVGISSTPSDARTKLNAQVSSASGHSASSHKPVAEEKEDPGTTATVIVGSKTTTIDIDSHGQAIPTSKGKTKNKGN